MKVHPERTKTDSSLRAEREKTDEHLAKAGAAIEEDADQVVELARERADALLEAARRKADEALQQGEDSPAAADAIAVERSAEDEVLMGERAVAAEKLQAEREEKRQALALLLAIEREETDERLRTERTRSDRAVASRDDFLAIVSHDVRGMLAGMAMSAELLLRTPVEGAAGEKVRQEAQRMRRLTGRMNRLIGDLLDVVSMESGKLSLVLAQQDATSLLTEMVESFQLTAAAREIRLVAAPSGPLRARFDHERILQVLTNLVGNAMKFTPPGGTIALHLAPVPGGIQFTVRDDGCGIPADQLDAIFERFSQAAAADRRGLGLGLYIARCIVQAHGGTIWAESEPGRGSAFHFTLPDAQSA